MKLRRITLVLTALVMLLVGVIPASAGQPGSGTSTIYVQNADSASDAQVVATFYGTDGLSAGSVNITTLPPYIGYTVNISDASPALPSTWSGSAVVSSNMQVSAVGRTIYTGVPDAPDGMYAGDYTAMAAPSDSAFLPYVFDSARNTVFAVQNTAGSAATITLNYLNRSDGSHITGSGSCSGSPIVDTIPANGVVYYDLLNQTRNGVAAGGAGGTIPCMLGGTSQPTPGSFGDFEGAVYITSTTNIAVAASTHWAKFEGVYTGATEDDTFLYFPQFVRAKLSSNGSWARWSAAIVQNTQNFPISITVSFIGGSGGNTLVFSDTIPALSSVGYNTRFQGNIPDSLWTNCTSAHGFQPTCALENQLGTYDWTGAATVRVDTPGGRIVGVNHVQYFAGRVFTYEGLQPGQATTIAVCPFMHDRDSGTNKRWGAALIQNASDSTATVSAYFFDQGSASGGLSNADLVLDNGGSGYSIAVGERMGMNSRFNVSGGIAASAFDPLGNDWTGSVVIVSDEPILVTMSNFRVDTVTGQDWATDYNCYNISP